MLGTINKAGQVLSLFTVEHPEWGLSEIARELHSPRSTVYELLASLVEIGLLGRTLQGRYRLGQRMISFSHLYLKTSLITQSSSEILQALGEQFNDAAQIAILVDLEVVIVNSASGHLPTIRRLGEDGRYPAHSNAMGKLLLSECKWETIKPILEDRGLAQYSPNTITQFDRLRSELEEIRRRGWAESVGESTIGVAAIASGVRNEQGQIVAALGVTVSMQRYSNERDNIRMAVANACARVSANMGYRESKEPKVVPPVPIPVVSPTDSTTAIGA